MGRGAAGKKCLAIRDLKRISTPAWGGLGRQGLHRGRTASLSGNISLALPADGMFAVWDCFMQLVPSKSLRFRAWVSLMVRLIFALPLPFYSQFPIHQALYNVHGNLRGHRLRKDLA